MWKDKKVSVVFPTYNEKDSIRSVIEEFFATGYVDEIIVVNNNAAEGTKEEVEKTNAIQVFEKRQGYGWAMRRGMEECTGDLIILSEPDGTFCGDDVLKLLAYSDDVDVIFGTRTAQQLADCRSNMGRFLRVGNWFTAKLIEFLFFTNILTDVGCSMKLLSRRAYERVKPYFTVGTSHFNPELMCLVILSKIPFIEIPVKYQERVGKSMVTGDMGVAIWLGLRMILLIMRYRIDNLLTNKYRMQNRTGASCDSKKQE